MTLALRYVTHSEIGLVRKNNQDSGYASPRLLLIADGMGGAAAGDLASAVAVDTIRKVDAPIDGEGMLEVLAGAIHRANDRIADLVEDDYSLEGMGTTVTAMLFDGTQVALAHIGDSRAYLLRDGHLEQLTHDHSWVQSLVDDGKITEAEAAVHPHRSLLLKVINGQPANDPDLTMVDLRPGDRLMLCSDGLCGLVDDPEIEAGLSEADPDKAMAELVEAAHAEGGIDNISVIIADVIDDADSAAAAASKMVVLGAAANRKIPELETRIRPGAAIGAEDSTDLQRPPSSGQSPPADDEARYDPQPPKKGYPRRTIATLLALLLVIFAGLGAGYAWTRTQFYVGAEQDQVAIFQGLPEGLPGIGLSRVYEIQDLKVSELPVVYQEKVNATISVTDLSDARRAVAELMHTAGRCTEAPATASPTPTGSVSPTSGSKTPAQTPQPPATSPTPAKTATTSGSPPTTATPLPAPTSTPATKPGC